MVFRSGSFNPNNMTARGATSLPCSLFLAVSVNNTQRIVCGSLEKHLPRPSGPDPVYLVETAVSDQCLSLEYTTVTFCTSAPKTPPPPTNTQHESGLGIHWSSSFWQETVETRTEDAQSDLLNQIGIFTLAPDQRNLCNCSMGCSPVRADDVAAHHGTFSQWNTHQGLQVLSGFQRSVKTLVDKPLCVWPKLLIDHRLGRRNRVS